MAYMQIANQSKWNESGTEKKNCIDYAQMKRWKEREKNQKKNSPANDIATKCHICAIANDENNAVATKKKKQSNQSMSFERTVLIKSIWTGN